MNEPRDQSTDPKFVSGNRRPGFVPCTDEDCSAFDGMKHYHEAPMPSSNERPPQTTPNDADVDLLQQAVWQVLADMGTDSTSCCLAAKAHLRVAFEPFVNDMVEIEGFMSLEEAQRIVDEVS